MVRNGKKNVRFFILFSYIMLAAELNWYIPENSTDPQY